MNPKQLKKLKKQVKKAHQVVKKQPYIEQLMTYRDLFDDFPQIKFLINNVLESDRLIKNGLLPQPLPKLLLPDNIQDIIFKKVNEQYPQGNPEGDRLWNRYVDALPNWTGFCVIIATIWKRPMVCGPTSTRLTSSPFRIPAWTANA